MKKLTLLVISYLLLFALPASALAATLSLSPSSGTFGVGCSFSLDIIVDSGGAQTDGTDALLRYDNSRVSAASISKGTIYSDYPGTSINDESGKLAVSGLASYTQPFSGKGTLATVNFTVKPAAPVGATQITFEFNPNDKSDTTDSNVVERGTIADILSSVVNGNYVVGTGSCAAASPGPRIGPGGGDPGISTPSATQPPPQPTPTLPPTGTLDLTFTVAVLGSVLTILGILGLAFL